VEEVKEEEAADRSLGSRGGMVCGITWPMPPVAEATLMRITSLPSKALRMCMLPPATSSRLSPLALN